MPLDSVGLRLTNLLFPVSPLVVHHAGIFRSVFGSCAARKICFSSHTRGFFVQLTFCFIELGSAPHINMKVMLKIGACESFALSLVGFNGSLSNWSPNFLSCMQSLTDYRAVALPSLFLFSGAYFSDSSSCDPLSTVLYTNS